LLQAKGIRHPTTVQGSCFPPPSVIGGESRLEPLAEVILRQFGTDGRAVPLGTPAEMTCLGTLLGSLGVPLVHLGHIQLR
jgi:hypothetical protein